MLNDIRRWYLRNHTEITWFLIGWLAFGGAIHFGTGEYVNAAILWAIAFVNYIFAKK